MARKGSYDMEYKKPFFSTIAVCLAVLVSGCNVQSNEDRNNRSAFYAEDTEFTWPEHTVAEGIVAKTEFAEYSEDVQDIKVTIENNSDKNFYVISDLFTLEQLCDGEWKYLNFIGFTFGSRWHEITPGKNTYRNIRLDGNVLLPLPKGRYRIGVGDISFESPAFVAYAEFDVV